MRSRISILALLVIVMLLVGRPRPAQASDVTTPLIISSGVTGGVALIYLIAVAAGDRDEPEFLELVSRGAPEAMRLSERIPIRTQCPLSDGTRALLCW